MQSINTPKKKRKHRVKSFIFFLVFELIFTGVTAPLIIFNGPFTNIKKTIVGASMTTQIGRAHV